MSVLTVFAAVGCGLNAGIFYAFSTFIMRALGKLPAGEGADAMRRINIDVINPMFMAVFMGTPLLCVVLIGWSVVDGQVPGDGWRIVGALLHVVGCFGVTVVCNVPLNNRLAKAQPGTQQHDAVWAHYLKRWTMWNTVRTIAPMLAMVALIVSLRA